MQQLSISTNQSSLSEQRYPNLGSPNNTSPWANKSIIESTSEIIDEEMYEWSINRGFLSIKDEQFDINVQKSDGSPPGALIHLAAFEGNVQKCKWLYERGADLGLRVIQSDTTPMHYAMKSGSQNVCIFLLKHEREVDLRTKDGSGKLPVDYAKEFGYIRLIRWYEAIKKGEDWSADAPGQSITEKALCPPIKKVRGVDGNIEGEEVSAEEKVLADKIAARKFAMEEAGLDSETFSGFM